MEVPATFDTADVMHCRRYAVQNKGIKLKEDITCRSRQGEVGLRNNTVTFQSMTVI